MVREDGFNSRLGNCRSLHFGRDDKGQVFTRLCGCSDKPNRRSLHCALRASVGMTRYWVAGSGFDFRSGRLQIPFDFAQGRFFDFGRDDNGDGVGADAYTRPGPAFTN